EVAFRAKSLMVQGDFTGALLMAVVALEGAHAAFLGTALMNQLGPLGDSAQRVVDDLLREQGMYTLCQLTPFLFMSPAERPAPDALTRSLEGITMRNAIMHSLRKKGKYKARLYNSAQMSDAFSAVLKVYEAYVSALETREA